MRFMQLPTQPASLPSHYLKILSASTVILVLECSTPRLCPVFLVDNGTCTFLQLRVNFFGVHGEEWTYWLFCSWGPKRDDGTQPPSILKGLLLSW